MILSGTSDMYMKLLTGKNSRQDRLKQDHVYLSDICSAFGIE